MTHLSTTITVTRDGAEIEVTIEGRVECFGSANPNERGEHITDWGVVEPDGFRLTPVESERAVERLYGEI